VGEARVCLRSAVGGAVGCGMEWRVVRAALRESVDSERRGECE
jgi:hypothetical protein